MMNLLGIEKIGNIEKKQEARIYVERQRMPMNYGVSLSNLVSGIDPYEKICDVKLSKNKINKKLLLL